MISWCSLPDNRRFGGHISGRWHRCPCRWQRCGWACPASWLQWSRPARNPNRPRAGSPQGHRHPDAFPRLRSAFRGCSAGWSPCHPPWGRARRQCPHSGQSGHRSSSCRWGSGGCRRTSDQVLHLGGKGDLVAGLGVAVEQRTDADGIAGCDQPILAGIIQNKRKLGVHVAEHIQTVLVIQRQQDLAVTVGGKLVAPALRISFSKRKP